MWHPLFSITVSIWTQKIDILNHKIFGYLGPFLLGINFRYVGAGIRGHVGDVLHSMA